MKKRITIVSKGNKKALCYTALIVLTDSQAQKLASESLLKQIDNVAIDLAVEWAVEVSGNYEILAISRTTFSPIEEEMLKDIEKTAHEFLANVDKLELQKPEPEPECPSHENTDKTENADETNAEKLAFVDSLIKDEELIRKNFRGIDVIAPYKGMPFAESLCRMTLDTWFEILKTYSVFNHGNTK